MLFIKRTNIKNKLFAIVLVAAFLAQDVAWAYPDLHGRKASDTLATQSFLQKDESPAKTQAMFIHRSMTERIQKPVSRISLQDIADAANSLVREYPDWAAENKITVTSSREEVIITFSPDYAIRYFISADGIANADAHPEMAVLSTVPFKNTNSIYKQLLKAKPGRSIEKTRKKARVLPPLFEAERLNAKINARVGSLLKVLRRSRLRLSYVVAPAMQDMEFSLQQYGFADTRSMRVLSGKISGISSKWETSARLSEKAGKLVAIMEERDAALEKVTIDGYRAVRNLIGDERRGYIVLLLEGAKILLRNAIEIRSAEKWHSTQVKRFEEILGHITENEKWINGKTVRPIRGLGYCAGALGAISVHDHGELGRLLSDLSQKLKLLDIIVETQDFVGAAMLRSVPPFKQLYGFSDRVFGKNVTRYIMAPGSEWIFLLPALLFPEYQTVVIGTMMLIFTTLHLSNMDWQDFERSPPAGRLVKALKAVASPLFLSLAAVYCSYSGDTLSRIILSNVALHSLTNALIAVSVEKNASQGPEETLKQEEGPDTRTEQERERAAKEALLDYYIDNASDILQQVNEKEGLGKNGAAELKKLFNKIAGIYINTADPALTEKRKKLLATLILLNIAPPVKAVDNGSAKVIQSKLRSDICREVLAERIFGNKKRAVFEPALEAVIELLAKDKKRGKAFFFDRYYPILRDSGRLPRFANALINVLINAEHHKIKLFNIDDENVFFDETKLIIKDLSSSMPSLRRDITSYLFNILREQGEIPLVRRLLDDINFHIVSGEEFGYFSAERVAIKIRQLQRERPDKPVVLVLSGGTTMPVFLDELSQMTDIDWLRVEIFHHTEYLGKSPENPYSFANMIQEHLVKKVYKRPDYGHFHPIGAVPSMRGYMEELSRFGGADILILGVGSNGHIGYNGVGTTLDEKESGSLKLVKLEASTIRENADKNPDIVKDPHAYTMSLADIMKARKIYLLASGPRKTHIIQTAFEEPLMPDVPVSLVLEHPSISIILDDKAVEGLAKDQFARYAETARKLDRAEDKMRLLINDKIKPSHKIDREGTIVWITPEEASILGYRPEDMLGRPVWDFVMNKERADSKKAVLNKLERPQELLPFERAYRRSDGKELWFYIEERQVIDEHGKVAGIISHMADITREKARRARLLSELQSIEVQINGNARIDHPSADMSSSDGRIPHPSADMGGDTVSVCDTANPFLLDYIKTGAAIEISAAANVVRRISMDRLNTRSPGLERHFVSNGTFKKISGAKNTALLEKILEKDNFRNLTPAQKKEIIGIVQDVSVSMILGKVYIGENKIKSGGYEATRLIFGHVRTGFNFNYHRLKPTVWVGEILFNRLSMTQLAQFLLEESQHILKKPEQLPDGTWINIHGDISGAAHPEWVIEHDRWFMMSLDKSEPTQEELMESAPRAGSDMSAATNAYRAKPESPDMATRLPTEAEAAAAYGRFRLFFEKSIRSVREYVESGKYEDIDAFILNTVDSIEAEIKASFKGKALSDTVACMYDILQHITSLRYCIAPRFNDKNTALELVGNLESNLKELDTIAAAGRLRDIKAFRKSAGMIDASGLVEYDTKDILNAIHAIALAGKTAGKLSDNSQILLSETLFDGSDRDNLKRMLGDASPVKILPLRDIQRALTNRKNNKNNLACVLTQADYDDAKLWGKKKISHERSTLLVLSQDLQGSRYLFLEGVVALAQAIMREDRESAIRYMRILFTTKNNMSAQQLLSILLNDPRKFSEYIKFKTEPFDKDKLYERYKTDVENYLVAA